MPHRDRRSGAVPRRPGRRLSRAFGITTTGRAAVLAVVLCALVLSVAVPLRNYLEVRADLQRVRAEQLAYADQVAELQRRRDMLNDPSYVEAQARERLRYVHPGETPYVVQLPPPAPSPDRQDEPGGWLTGLWENIVGAPESG